MANHKLPDVRGHKEHTLSNAKTFIPLVFHLSLPRENSELAIRIKSIFFQLGSQAISGL